MLTLELYVLVLEIPMMHIQHSVEIWLVVQHSDKSICKLIGWYCKIMRRQLWTLTCPICLLIIPMVLCRSYSYHVYIWVYAIWASYAFISLLFSYLLMLFICNFSKQAQQQQVKSSLLALISSSVNHICFMNFQFTTLALQSKYVWKDPSFCI